MATNASAQITEEAASDLDERRLVLVNGVLIPDSGGPADRRQLGPQQRRQWTESFHIRSITNGFAGHVEIASAQQTTKPVESLQMPMVRRAAKRFFDPAFGLPLALLFTPVMAVLATWSVALFRAWPISTHKRIRRGCREMTMAKIRRRSNHANAVATRCQSRVGGRVRLGGIARKTQLRDSPQLGLAVWGPMSLVGNRPGVPELISLFNTRQRSGQEALKPCGSGLRRLSDHSSGLMLEHHQYDDYGARSQDVPLDLWLLEQPSPVHLRGGRLAIGALPALLLSKGSTRSGRTAELSPVDPSRSM